MKEDKSPNNNEIQALEPRDQDNEPQVKTGQDKPQLTKEQIRGMDHDSVVEYNPERYRLYKNRAIFDKNTGRIVKAPPPEMSLTSASASVLAESRWRKARESANEGLSRLSTANSALDTWSNIIENKGRVALDKDNRAGTDAARFVGNAAGLLLDPRQPAQDKQSPGLTITMDQTTATALLRAIDAYQRDKDEPGVPSNEIIDA
jgi:hypothetical protein